MRLIADAWRQNVLTTVMTLMNGYAISVTGFLLLRWLVGESWSVIALFNSVAHLLFLPGLVLLPVALLLRRRGTALLLMPALLAFCVGYGAMFIPHTAQAAADSVQMRVLTYNLKAQTQVMQPALEVIIAADADVVALQELSEEMAGYLAAELAPDTRTRRCTPCLIIPFPARASSAAIPLLMMNTGASIRLCSG